METSRTARIGGVLGWPLCSLAAYVVITWSTGQPLGGGDDLIVRLLGAAYFGLLAWDLGLAAGHATALRRGTSGGTYSSAVGLAIPLLVVWCGTTAALAQAGGASTGWTGSFGAVAVVGTSALLGELAAFRAITRRSASGAQPAA